MKEVNMQTQLQTILKEVNMQTQLQTLLKKVDMTNTGYTGGKFAAAAGSRCSKQRACLLLDGVWLGRRSQGGGCRTPQTSKPALGTLAVHLLLQTSARLVTICRAHTFSPFAALYLF